MNKREFTLADLISLFRKKWWIMLICALLVAAGSGFYSIQSYQEVYTSTVMFYVRPDDSVTEGWSADQDIARMNWAMKVINSYVTVLRTYDFAEKLTEEYMAVNPESFAEQYPGVDMEDEDEKISVVKDVRSHITISVIEETNIFRLQVNTRNATWSYNLASVAVDTAPEFISMVAEVKSIQTADQPREPEYASNGMNLPRNTLIGFATGAVLSFLLLFVIDLLDVRIKNEEDIINNYTLPIIGAIPVFGSEKKSKRGYRYYG